MEDDNYYRIRVSGADITIKKIVIEITNGGINPKQENVTLRENSIFLAQSINNSNKDGYLNITLKDGSNLMEVPAINVVWENPKSSPVKKNKKSGCGGCAQRRKELEEIRKKELERQTNGTN